MKRIVQIGDQHVGDGHPTFIVAEIGINHNGDLKIAKKLIDAAYVAGCDAVKFQKRTPNTCVPLEQRNKMRETPWGYISYLEYRHRVEFGKDEYQEIDRYCRDKSIIWFSSCWDVESINFMEEFDPPAYKIPSALLTNVKVLQRVRATGRLLILSTGMSTMDNIQQAVKQLGTNNLILAHCTSTYPCPLGELNLRLVQTLRDSFNCPIGYSGHETGLATTVAAVALGADFVERHITIDRAMWGSDQSASIEPIGVQRMVKDIRAVESALGDGIKRIYESELPIMARLRGIDSVLNLERANGETEESIRT